MATSRNVQYLGKDATGTRIDDSDLSSRRQVEYFIPTAGAAIAIGDWVMLDTSATGSLKAVTVKTVTADTEVSGCVGCALSAVTADEATAGKLVQVVVRGYHSAAKVKALMAAGVTICTNGDSAGTGAAGTAYATVAATVIAPCGLTLGAESGGTAPVYVSGQF